MTVVASLRDLGTASSFQDDNAGVSGLIFIYIEVLSLTSTYRTTEKWFVCRKSTPSLLAYLFVVFAKHFT